MDSPTKRYNEFTTLIGETEASMRHKLSELTLPDSGNDNTNKPMETKNIPTESWSHGAHVSEVSSNKDVAATVPQQDFISPVEKISVTADACNVGGEHSGTDRIIEKQGEAQNISGDSRGTNDERGEQSGTLNTSGEQMKAQNISGKLKDIRDLRGEPSGLVDVSGQQMKAQSIGGEPSATCDIRREQNHLEDIQDEESNECEIRRKDPEETCLSLDVCILLRYNLSSY